MRTVVFAVTAAQLGALGHVAGGGHAPDRALLLLAAVASGAALHPLTRRRLNLKQLVAATAAGQLLFHLLFLVGTHPMSEGGDGTGSGTVAMVLFHLVAAGATALLLAGGESALFRLFAAWRRTVLRVLAAAAVRVPPAWSVVPAAGDGALSGAQLAAVRVVRGPPGAVPAR